MGFRGFPIINIGPVIAGHISNYVIVQIFT